MTDESARAGRSAGAGLRAALTSLPVRVLVTAALLALVARAIDWSALGDSLADASWGWFVAAVGLIVASYAVGAVRWRMLLVAAGIGASIAEAARAYVAGAFANNLLPTGFGGDAVRAWMVGRSRGAVARSLTSVLVDRASALACGLALAWLGAAFDPDGLERSHVILLAVISAGAVVAGLAVALMLRGGPLARLVPGFARGWAAEGAGALRAYLGDRGLIVRVIALGLAFQGFIVAAIWALSEMLDLALSPALIAVVVPLVLIATVIPLSLGGFGVREGSFAALLSGAGVSVGDATLLSLLSVAAMAIASLPGGMVLLVGRRGRGGSPIPSAPPSRE